MDIHCRICGEPYSCVGGLHFTHTDMPWWEFNQFIRGKGCPCCFGERRNDEATARPILDRKWYESISAASDEVTPYLEFAFLADQPPEFGKYECREPSLKARLSPARLALMEVISKDWEGRLGETETEVAKNVYERRWWFKLNEEIVSDYGRQQLLARANLAGFEKFANEPGADWEGCEWDTEGGAVRVLVFSQLSNSDQLKFHADGVALVNVVEERAEGEIFDDEIYEKMVEEAYAESLEEEQSKLVDQTMTIFGCSKDVATFVLGRIENLFRQEWEDGEPIAYRDEKLRDDLDVLVQLAGDLGLAGWTIAQSLGVYGGDCYALVPTDDPYLFPGETFGALLVVNKDGVHQFDGAPSPRKTEYCIKYGGLDFFNDVKLPKVPKKAAREIMTYLKGDR